MTVAKEVKPQRNSGWSDFVTLAAAGLRYVKCVSATHAGAG